MRTLNLIISALCVSAFLGCAPEPQTPRDTRFLNTQEKIALCISQNCETLNIDRGDMEDFSELAALTHVRALRMSWTDFDDLNDIAAMPQLEELHVSSTQLRDLNGLDAFPMLRVLHVQWNSELDDFSPIGGVTTLTELALGGNDVGDMAFVANLSNLDGLSLVNGTVSSFEALRSHPNLSRLDLEATDMPADISPLLSIPGLKMVSIRNVGHTAAQKAVFDELRAKGVVVEDIQDAVVVIC